MGNYRALAEYLRRWLAAGPAAGLAIGLTDRRQTLYTAGIGYADLASRSPVTSDTTFQIGSIGKSMTALAVLQLVERGRLDLNAPLSTHLPWFAMPSRYGPIALRHALSHTAGLPSGTDFTPAARYEGFALRETEAAWEPGSRFHYSNTGYKLLGWLLEDVTGQSYGSIIRERALEPLGMTATDPVMTHQTRHRMATGYVPLHDDRPLSPERYDDSRHLDGIRGRRRQPGLYRRRHGALCPVVAERRTGRRRPFAVSANVPADDYAGH